MHLWNFFFEVIKLFLAIAVFIFLYLAFSGRLNTSSQLLPNSSKMFIPNPLPGSNLNENNNEIIEEGEGTELERLKKNKEDIKILSAKEIFN